MEYIERVLLRHTAPAAAIEDARAPEAVVTPGLRGGVSS